MKFQDFVDKVKGSSDFQGFTDECPGAYLCAGFFVIDYKEGKNEISIDYFNPRDKNIISFKFQDKITKVPLEPIKENYTPIELNGQTNLEVEQLKDIILDEMHNRGMTYEIEKLIIILQDIDGKLIWNCTGLLSSLNLLKVHVEDNSKSILLMEKSSFFDFVKPVKPGQNLKDVLKQLEDEKIKVDPEKAEGDNEGFIG